MMVLGLVADVDVDSIGGIIHVDRILHLANDLFLSDQVLLAAWGTVLLVRGVLSSDPNGKFIEVSFTVSIIGIKSRMDSFVSPSQPTRGAQR